jgi:hypothetical protein
MRKSIQLALALLGSVLLGTTPAAAVPLFSISNRDDIHGGRRKAGPARPGRPLADRQGE